MANARAVGHPRDLTFFIDRKGHVIRRVVGYIDPETLDSYALEILAQ